MRHERCSNDGHERQPPRASASDLQRGNVACVAPTGPNRGKGQSVAGIEHEYEYEEFLRATSALDCGVALDCQACGACCVNLPSNHEVGFDTWVEIAPEDEILERADLHKKHVMYDAEGVPHLRLAPDGRCLALRGALGDRVSCGIYHARPSPCRTVQPGDNLCLLYRGEHGL